MKLWTLVTSVRKKMGLEGGSWETTAHGCMGGLLAARVRWGGAYFHVTLFRKVDSYWQVSDLAALIHTSVIPRLGYLNVLYMGLPLNTIWTLPLVQDVVACLRSKALVVESILPFTSC